MLFVIDLSEECGYSIPEQVGLFHSLLVLFKNKEILVILNKTDKRTLRDLPVEQQKMIQEMGKGMYIQFQELYIHQKPFQ